MKLGLIQMDIIMRSYIITLFPGELMCKMKPGESVSLCCILLFPTQTNGKLLMMPNIFNQAKN